MRLRFSEVKYRAENYTNSSPPHIILFGLRIFYIYIVYTQFINTHNSSEFIYDQSFKTASPIIFNFCMDEIDSQMGTKFEVS